MSPLKQEILFWLVVFVAVVDLFRLPSLIKLKLMQREGKAVLSALDEMTKRGRQ